MHFILLLISLEFRINRQFVHILPQDTNKAVSTDSISFDNYVKLPLNADWINTSTDGLLVLKKDTVFNFNPYTLLITGKRALRHKGVLKIYTDKKGKLIYLTHDGAFYENGKRAKYKILSDTFNIVFGKTIHFHKRSPVFFKRRRFYIKNGRVFMDVKIDTASTRLIPYSAPEFSSYIAKDTIYTKSGSVMVHGRVIKKGLPEGIAIKRNDTVFVFNLKDTVYILSYPSFTLSGIQRRDDTPFKDLFADFDGNVYFHGRKIYKDRYFVSATMVDVDGDGKEEIVLGRVDGSFAVLRKIDGRYQEWMSYSPPSSLYKRYISSDGIPMFYRALPENSPFAAFVDTVNPLYRDEILYVIEHASAEFNDSLLRVGVSYLYDNVFDIYLAARRLKYVNLLELKGGRTTLILNGKDTIPPEIYYRFVVFPRVLYEFPEKTLFRSFFMNDHTYGKSVIEIVENDTTVMDAVKDVYTWAKSFMHFGYMTNDLSPVVIYKKAYGSCGEHSIMSAALFKTVLIPSYVAVDMGEDHQWNEFFNGKRWVHFDLTQNEKKAIDNPYASSEGMGHKEVSTVIGVVPEGGYFPITHHGYTRTGRVNIKVVDVNGNPVGFALVVLVSHWAGRESISFFKFTDKDGKTFFDAGHEENGYSLYVYSPYGVGGIGNFMVEEDSSLNLVVKLKGEVGGKNARRILGRAVLFYRNFRTGETMPALDSAYVYESHGTLMNPYGMATLELIKEDTLYGEDMPPSLQVEIESDTIKNGMPLVFKIRAKDNLGVKNVKATLTGPVRRVFTLKKNFGTDSLYLNSDTVIPSGNYTITFKAFDFSGKTDSVTDRITVLPSEYFVNQRIKQDAIGEAKGSWNYTFAVKDTLPFLFIHTKGITQRMDIDLFLKRDNSVVAKSTSPTANETIYLHPVIPGTYTVTVQGWYVPHGTGVFNIRIER